MKGNPQDIFDDPEFQALNPQYTRSDFPAVSMLNRGQFLPLVVSGNSDLVHELTRWLRRTRRAGVPRRQPGSVRHAHEHVLQERADAAGPVPALDPGYTAPESNGVPGISTMQVTWNPLNGLSNVSRSLVIDRPSAINPTLPACGDGVPCVYQRFGSQPPGNRAVFAVVGLADAAADRFPVAKLVNGGGKAVGPTDTGLSAALANMTRQRRHDRVRRTSRARTRRSTR